MMTSDEQRFFDLKTAPFSKEISDDELWLPPSKQPIVDALCEAVKAKQCVLLTGEPGVGKTCVLRAVRSRLTSPNIRLTYCHNVMLGRRDFYRQLCVALDLRAKATAAALFYAVSTHVEELARDKIRPVLLLDEAHLLHQDTLDHLHVLLNYEWDSQALLSLVLIGLPTLEDRLSLRHNRSLYSRLHVRLRIDALTADDTAAYVQNRLEQAGTKTHIFAYDALAALHEATLGNMRDIDRFASLILSEAKRRDQKKIQRDIVMRVVEQEQRYMVGA